MSEKPTHPPPRLRITGLALFLFIPVVLYLFVAHPRPFGLSLALGVALMVGHRFLARPYMETAKEWKCLWSNRLLNREEPGESLALATGERTLEARCLRRHHDDARRFFAFLHAWRWPLRLGIFVPLLTLLLTLVVAAAGRVVPLAEVTAVFQLMVGLTVQVAAWGYRLASPTDHPQVPFPVHNFFLLGIRNLLWIFRLVGLWWVLRGFLYFWG